MQSLGNLARALCPIIEPAERRVGEELGANNFRASPQQSADIHKRVRPRIIICGDPITGIDIQLPPHSPGRGAEAAQIVGGLFQHAKGEIFLRSRLWRFGREDKETSARVIGLRT